MRELLIFYGLLSILVAAGVGYSLYLYSKRNPRKRV